MHAVIAHRDNLSIGNGEAQSGLAGSQAMRRVAS
jgi:hypothetical protein